MNIEVYCYAGYKGEQEPREFRLGSKTVGVDHIVDRWQGIDHRYFRVKGSDRNTHLLRYDQLEDQWELVQTKTSKTHTGGANSMSSLTAEQTAAGPCRINRIHHPGAGRKPVILLHGAKFEAETWLNLGTLDVLIERGYPVHALDMPGFGKSQTCQAAKSEVLREYISRENLNLPVIVGPSRGGRYALETYFAHPELIGGLVLVGSVGIEENKSRFRTLSVPCLLVWGSGDTISDPENGQFLNREITDSRLVILEDAPHPCYLDKTELWHQSLLQFLDERFN